VRASELPRGALVEYQVNVHIGREDCDPPQSKDDDDDDDEDLSPTYASGDIAGAHWETCVAPPSRRGARVAIFLPRELAPMLS
jgi:diphthine-ammonia ligase